MSEREAEERKRGVGRRGERSKEGELAQLARASALHAEGQRFESVILHNKRPEVRNRRVSRSVSERKREKRDERDL